MNKQAMKNLVFQVLEEGISDPEFRPRKSEDAFVRKIVGGKQMLGVPLWDHSPRFDISLNICIRLDAAEQIYHRFSGSPPKYQSMSTTTITRLEYFTGGPRRYSLVTADDVTSVGREICKVVRDKVIPFLDRHKDAKSLDEAVNCTQPGLDITQDPAGSMEAVILAHLAGNPDFDAVVTKLRQRMELSPEADHAFNRLAAYLKEEKGS